MPPAESLTAYADCEQLCERALNAPNGIAVRDLTEQSAQRLVYRLNSFRVRDRRRSYRIYGHDHPMRGKSPYDILEFRRFVSGGAWEVQIKRIQVEDYTVVEL